MPFGLTNAPATFQAFIQETLHDILDISCVIYLDDILIFSKPDQDHEKLVTQVLERLRNANLFANVKNVNLTNLMLSIWDTSYWNKVFK